MNGSVMCVSYTTFDARRHSFWDALQIASHRSIDIWNFILAKVSGQLEWYGIKFFMTPKIHQFSEKNTQNILSSILFAVLFYIWKTLIDYCHLLINPKNPSGVMYYSYFSKYIGYCVIMYFIKIFKYTPLLSYLISICDITLKILIGLLKKVCSFTTSFRT